MSSILVLQANPDINLSPITQRLWQENIPHRVVMNTGSQDLWVARAEDAEKVKAWVQQWQAGELTLQPDPAEQTPWQINLEQHLMLASKFPVTVCLLVAIVIIFMLQQVGFIGIKEWLLKPELWSGEKLDVTTFWLNETYLWFSPALVHLSLIHIVMNGFWWWVLGREVEARDGHITLVWLTVVLAIGAGFAQYLAVGPYFAGLSGVVYGLMGWAWARQTFKETLYQLPRWLFPFMIVSMVVIMLVDSMGMDLNIGHESHLAGAVLGVLFALVLPKKFTKEK
jgi:GlpG protein